MELTMVANHFAGVFWVLTYALIIWRCFKDKTYGMPIAALCFNNSWEFMFTFVHPHPASRIWTDIVPLSLNLVVLWQCLKYGPREFETLSKRTFYGMFALGLPTAFCVILFFGRDFGDREGFWVGYFDNIMMSVLFIAMFFRRKSRRGQSRLIAISKLLGTACTFPGSISYALAGTQTGGFDAEAHGRVHLLVFICVTVVVFDLVYLLALSAPQLFFREWAEEATSGDRRMPVSAAGQQ